MAQVTDRNQDATVYVGDLDAQVGEALLWELMLQAGPVVNVHIPKDKLSGTHSGFGFVEFHGEEDADYAIKIMNMVKLFGKPIRVNKAARNNRSTDVGANLFIGNLDPEVDEKVLYDTFSVFGVIIATPKIMRDPENGSSKGYGFVSYDNFAASDMAIQMMNGQYLCNRPVSVTYALKKDSKGERHGAPAERLLAQQSAARVPRPNTMFGAAGGAPGGMPMGMPPMPMGMGMGMGMGAVPPGMGMPPMGMPMMAPPPPGPAFGAYPPPPFQPGMPQQR